jgi:hypothetical protein
MRQRAPVDLTQVYPGAMREPQGPALMNIVRDVNWRRPRFVNKRDFDVRRLFRNALETTTPKFTRLYKKTPGI